MDRARWAASRFAALACLAAGAGGCFAQEKPDIHSPDAALKIPAIKSSVRQRDCAAVETLVGDLDSDDAAIRFYAIQGLYRLTGQTFGYRYYDDEIRRKPALKKWQAWLLQHDTEPATQPSKQNEYLAPGDLPGAK